MRIKSLFAIAALCAWSGASAQQQLAFPEAQGFGRFALGARASSAPTVYHVTNLNDSGAGSLRDAVSKGNRIVVFDVSGVIRISSRIVFASNLYVAGQTAPGEGITVYGDGVSFSSASNIICRYLRIRMGHGGSNGKDCAGISRGTNMIFDHCSFSWGLDETFSINPDGGGDLYNITIQNTIIGQGLMTHSAGGLIQADYITLYRNLYCDNSTRNNKVKGKSQYANNIVYNWKNGAYIMGGDSEGKSYVNLESNLFINGPAGGGAAFTGANADFHCYGNDNWQDSNADGVFAPKIITDYNASTRESKPYDYPVLDLYAGNELIEKNLPTVGASLPYRDQSDCYMVDEVKSFGKSGALITYETALPIGAPDTWAWWKGTKVTDTDGDGMPDWWEEANGTNKSVNDACKKAANGYLNIENYINSITVDDRQFFLRRPITVEQANATTSTMTISWRDYTYAEDGFIIEVQKNGKWEEAARTAANATECKVSGLEPGTEYNVRMRAFANVDGEERYSDYTATEIFLTRPIEIGAVDIDTYVPDNTLGETQDVLNYTTTLWKENVAMLPKAKILLNTDSEQTLTVDETVEPASVVVNGTGKLTIKGTKDITGQETSLNKGNTGTLVLNNRNSYAGPTINHQGVIEFNSIANGGLNSSLGASKSFAQNWVFDGGTYKYTGATASTDRNARIDRESVLAIDKATTTLTMNGTFEGKGNFVLDGAGTLSIPSYSFFGYSGKTILRGGNLYMSNTEEAKKLGADKNRKIVLGGGGISVASKNEDFQTLEFPIEVEDGKTGFYSLPTHGYIQNDISGNGTIELRIPYLRAYFRSTLPNFTGKIIAKGTGNSTLFFNNSGSWDIPNVRVELKGGINMAGNTTNANNRIGGLSGDAGTFLIGSGKNSAGFKCLWEVGSANSDETFHGVINNLPWGLNSAYSGTTSIKKVGTGDWRLTGNNVYSGTTAVEGGNLIINGTNSGTGAVTVANNGTLKGIGTIAGKVTVQNGGTLCPGDTIVNGSMLKLTGGLALSSGSTLRIPLAYNNEKLKTNQVRINGTLTITSGAKLELDLAGMSEYELKAGDTFAVFNSTTLITKATGEFTEIIPATPGEGLHWDTRALVSKGILRVSDGTDDDSEIELEDEIKTINATLDHTASVQGGSNAAGKFLDEEVHYYNNWGSVSWAAQAFSQFSFSIPEGAKIQDATYTIYVNCARGTRTFDVTYLPAGTKAINTKEDIPELMAKTGKSLASYSDITTNYVAKSISVTNAIQDMVNAGQGFIQFVMSNGAAGGNIYGKKSSKAPTLSITYEKNKSTDIAGDEIRTEQINTDDIYDIYGRKVSPADGNVFSLPKGIYIQNGRKIINR